MPVSYTPADGLSFEKCIFVDSVEEEYEWMDIAYPGFELVEQAVTYHQSRPYDVITILLWDGTQATVYFDISEFYEA